MMVRALLLYENISEQPCLLPGASSQCYGGNYYYRAILDWIAFIIKALRKSDLCMFGSF